MALTKDNNKFQLKNVDQETDLGITVDSKLSFDQHVQVKVNKANSITCLIRRTFGHLDEENVLMLYKALVRPHLEYGNAIWHHHNIEHITAIGFLPWHIND
jgi:ribonuclease P/MRP protein subunit RPP40